MTKAQLQQVTDTSKYHWLADRAFNHTSQFGEDGIIEAIFERIGTTNKYVVDVGAGDGLMFSNSRWLIEQGWSAALFECDESRWKQCVENSGRFWEEVSCTWVAIESAGENSLDSRLSRLHAPTEPDLLSLDIDGQDYWVFNSLLKYKPRVVVIEYDPNVDPAFIPEPNGPGQAGIEAIMWVAQTKNYVPVGRTQTNLILVKRELAGLLETPDVIGGERVEDIKIAALMSTPRFGPLTARGVIEAALRPFNIPLNTFGGVFWGQCMQRALETYVDEGLDWVLTIDYDSLFTAQHLDRLIGTFGSHPEIDALAALQCRRGSLYPLMTIKGEKGTEVNGDPIQVTTAHFGMTLIRLDALKCIPKPWFKTQPDEGGGYGDERLDDDIWFWHQWREAGKSLYVAPNVSIGHLEETVAVFDEHMQASHIYVKDWLDTNDPKRARIVGA